jgi:hypothetical protein
MVNGDEPRWPDRNARHSAIENRSRHAHALTQRRVPRWPGEPFTSEILEPATVFAALSALSASAASASAASAASASAASASAAELSESQRALAR